MASGIRWIHEVMLMVVMVIVMVEVMVEVMVVTATRTPSARVSTAG